MFEVRLGRAPGWRVVAPSPPEDVTPDQVRQAVAGFSDTVSAVELSAAFLYRRTGSDVGEWRRLDQELEAAGIDVYFAPGGAASWEIKVSVAIGPASPSIAVNGPESQEEAVTPAYPISGTEERVLQPESSADEDEGTIPVETRISRLAGQGLSARKISAALLEEGYPAMSHMRVTRTLRREAELPPKEESNWRRDDREVRHEHT